MFSYEYDCIWMQWALSSLFDEDAIRLLKLAKNSLKKN